MGIGIFVAPARQLWGVASVLRAVLVDDEVGALEALRLLLEQHCQDVVQVVATAVSAEEARQILQQLRADVLFLDVEMPGEDGFALLRSLRRRDFAVIFVTAHQQYLLQALRISAADYLLKPVNPEELREAVLRVQQSRLQAERLDVLLSNLSAGAPKRLVIPLVNRYRLVSLQEVLYCQAHGSYSWVVTDRERLLAVRLLAEWEEILEPSGFVRAHRSFLVNVQRVCELRQESEEQSGSIVLDTGEEIPVARRRFAYVLAALQRG
ncbi:MAG: LytTR family DNA-binding domain-containing protein [Chlorobiota bacterium]